MYLHKNMIRIKAAVWGEALHLGEYIFPDLQQFSGSAAVYPRPATRDPRPATRAV